MSISLRQRLRLNGRVVSVALATGMMALQNTDGVGVGIGAMILGALGLGLGLVVVGIIRRSHGQTDR
jgi:hypothetical protein